MTALVDLFSVGLFNSVLRIMTPVLLAALGGAICARVGIFNIALEGKLLAAAFFAVLGSYISGSAWVGILFGVLAGVGMAILFAVTVIDLRADEIIVGVALNLFAAGLTAFALPTIFGVVGTFYHPALAGIPQVDIPVLQDIAVAGDILSGHSVLVYVSWLAVIWLYIFLFYQVTGLRLRAVGEYAEAGRSLGINVRRIQYLAILLAGVLCGLGGAQLSIGQVELFSEGMTSGRGFIALVAMMFGRSHPLGVAGASLLFAFFEAAGSRLQGVGVPTQFSLMIPFVATLVAMFFFKQRPKQT